MSDAASSKTMYLSDVLISWKYSCLSLPVDSQSTTALQPASHSQGASEGPPLQKQTQTAAAQRKDPQRPPEAQRHPRAPREEGEHDPTPDQEGCP